MEGSTTTGIQSYHEDDSSPFAIQVMSDLHLEFGTALQTHLLPQFEVKAKIIALVGDIGNPK